MKRLAVLLALVMASPAMAEKIVRVEVKGNERIDSDMIRNLSPLKAGDEADERRLNSALRSLYNSKFFSDVKVGLAGGTLKISVKENLLVGEVAIEGNSALPEEDVKKQMTVKPHTIFSAGAVKKDLETLRGAYKQLGFFRADIDAKTILRQSGVVDVVFEVSEGKKAYIESIEVNGNEAFSQSAIVDAMLSKPYRWWAMFENYDVYHEERIAYDAELVRQFYTGHGFLDFTMLSYTAKMAADERSFYITMSLNEGKRYKIAGTQLANSIADLDTAGLEDEILLRAGDFYSESLAKRTITNLSAKIGERGFAFVSVERDLKPNAETGEVTVVFRISEGAKAFVGDINIVGNTRTYDSIIRRNLLFDEQSAFTPGVLAASEQKLMGLGYFENVKITPRPVLGVSDKASVEVALAEKSTGQMSFGAGWSSINNGFLELGIQENNFMGKGQTLGFKAAFSRYQNNYAVSFVEPYLFGRDLMGGADTYYSQNRYRSTYGYDRNVMGIAPKMGWSYNENLSHRVVFAFRNEKLVNLSPEVAARMIEGADTYDLFRLSNTLTWRDQTVDWVNDTRRGYVASYTNSYAGFGGDKYYVKNDGSFKQYFSFFSGSTQLGFTADVGEIHAVNGAKLNSSDRYILGADNMRGFEYGGIGARYRIYGLGGYSLGGDWQAVGTMQLNFPVGLPPKFGLKGYLFVDWGTLGRPEGVDPMFYEYDSMVRVSHGYGFLWNSPIGEINLSWAWQDRYAAEDRLQRFRFSVGNNF